MPRRLICFDTESVRDRQLGSEEHNFRLGVASFDTLDAQIRSERPTQWLETESASELWSWIASKTNRNHRTVAFAHNLSFDLRLSQALRYLPKLGFDVQGIGLNSYSCWVRLRRDRNTLWLCDSLSFLPAALERIAPMVALDKPPLPEDDDTSAVWLARCRADVEVTRAAVLRVLGFLRAENLGDFRLTGAAMASAGYRHRFMPQKTLLVHDNAELLAIERESAYAGRAEVWRHGDTNETVYEYDFQYAYARLAQELELPYRFECEHSPLEGERFDNVAEHQAILSRCIVTTEIPVVATVYDNHIVWPIGRFGVYLWDNEARLAKEAGADVLVERCWLYARDPILKSWADWIIEKLDAPTDAIDPVARLMLKDWSRALIGRFGLRYPLLEEIGRVPSYDLAHRGVWDIDADKELTYLQLGQQLFEQTEKVESSDSIPAIMSYIMAASRVKLWQLMQTAGLENLYYVDTDGIICNRRAAKRIDAALADGAMPGLRLKGTYNGGSFRAPRNIDLGDERRVNGAPRKAERLTSGVYRGEVWESLPAALRRRHAEKVFVHEREFHISDNDPRRLHLADGATAPLRLASVDGQNILAESLDTASC